MAQISGFRNQRKMSQSEKSLSIPDTPTTKFKINETEIVLHDILPENTSATCKINPFSSSKLEFKESRKWLREKKKAEAIERRENKIRLRILKKEEFHELYQINLYIIDFFSKNYFYLFFYLKKLKIKLFLKGKKFT